MATDQMLPAPPTLKVPGEELGTIVRLRDRTWQVVFRFGSLDPNRLLVMPSDSTDVLWGLIEITKRADGNWYELRTKNKVVEVPQEVDPETVRAPTAIKRVEPPSRAKRWADACSTVSTGVGMIEDGISQLVDLQSEYQDWLDNLGEGLDQTATAELLQEVCDLDLEYDIDAITSTVDECEGIQLPVGFGRD